MKRVYLKRRYFVSIAVIMSFMVFALPILAQMDDMQAGLMDGQRDAQANTNRTLWLAAGCLGGWIGLAAAYFMEPNPPATSLLGKSPEYVAAYTDSYRQTAKQLQTGKAWTGFITGAIVSAGCTCIYVAAVMLFASNSDFN